MYNAENYMIDDRTTAEIRRESARAIQKHGRENTPASDAKSRGFKLAVLMEEVGEVAKAINEFEMGVISKEQFLAELRKELSQVAAAAGLWLQCEIQIGG